ncbi:MULTISPECIES: hypothetical protein [unclassified Streptomyces]|uniref:hypothetical protein n=1 Tax=unclassified Streptomyces TaxID=2593676 RepID=UPI0011E68282|nr:hypothetical protein [Streptomyces sp. sk2.1]TXS67021.1 hypothetical protein EAO76_29490 [Streptomyces sp. sk2.1]
MNDATIIAVLAVAGVLSIVLFSLKGLLDQIPDVLDAAGRTREAWLRLRRPEPPLRAGDEEQPPGQQVQRGRRDQDQEPPVAA